MDFSYATTASETDWNEWNGRNVDVRDGGITLETATAIRQSDLETRAIDHAVDPSGVLYTVRPSGGLYRYDPDTELEQQLLDRTEATLTDPVAVCATADRVFVIDAIDGRIAVLSPRLQRLIGTLETPASEPAGLAHSDGTIYVLDEREGIVTVERGKTTDSTTGWDLGTPTDIAADDGQLYLLDPLNGVSTVRAFRGGEEVESASVPGATFETEDGPVSPVALSVTAGRLFVTGAVAGETESALYEWDPDSESFSERHRFDDSCVELDGRFVENTEQYEFYGLLGDDQNCHALTETSLNKRHPRRDRYVGTAFQRFDSGAQGNEWHRLSLGIGRSSASTQVRVRYFATDSPALVELDAAEITRLAPKTVDMLRDDGITSVWELINCDPDRVASRHEDVFPRNVRYWQGVALSNLSEHAEGNWTTVDSLNPTDVLFEDGNGRYLFVNLELVGTPESAPRVDSVRAFCPRQTYLRYLPELYQDDDQSTEFLERFLSVFERIFVDIEEEIDGIGQYFDPQGVPSESLAWLERWLAVDSRVDWPESARRELLARAPELYKQRGTKRGLRELVELYLRYATPVGQSTGLDRADGTDPDSPAAGTADTADSASMTHDTPACGSADTPSGHRLYFLDHSSLESIEREAAWSQYASELPDRPGFALFCGPLRSDDERAAVEALASSQKPAHVGSAVVFLENECTLGSGTFLGINSKLTSREFSLGEAALGGETVLEPRN